MKTTIGELKNLHMGCGKVRLMFQDEAGFGRINHPKYCWCEKGIRWQDEPAVAEKPAGENVHDGGA